VFRYLHTKHKSDTMYKNILGCNYWVHSSQSKDKELTDYHESDNVALSALQRGVFVDLEICIVERNVMLCGNFGGRQPQFYIVKTIVGELGGDEVA
jgi:hypothetical protein